MPPRHLVLPLMGELFVFCYVEKDADPSYPGDGSSAPFIRITDLSGAPPSQLLSTIRSLASPNESKPISTISTTLLITPAYLLDAAEDKLSSLSGAVDWPPRQMFEGRTFGVHVDMDRLDAIAGASWERMGVGVWEV